MSDIYLLGLLRARLRYELEFIYCLFDTEILNCNVLSAVTYDAYCIVFCSNYVRSIIIIISTSLVF